MSLLRIESTERFSYLPQRVSQQHRAAPRHPHEPNWRARALLAVNHPLCRIYHRLKILSRPKLPRQGAAIIICNHISALDPALIQSACPRLVTWMMAKEYYEIRPLTWAFRTIHAIPVERSGRDMAATRAAMRALDAGQVLGVFPEGRIETSRELLPFQTGVALLAARAGVNVIPAYLDGDQRGRDMLASVLSPCRAQISFGEPIQFARRSTTKAALEAATDELLAAVAALRAQTVR